MRTTLVLLALAALGTACGAKVTVDGDAGLLGGGGSGGSLPANEVACDVTEGGVHVCITFTSSSPSELMAEKEACTSASGTMVGACSGTNALGTCSVSAGGITEAETFYTTSGLTAAAAQMACTDDGGNWTGG
jgi:hypothetical protein